MRKRALVLALVAALALSAQPFTTNADEKTTVHDVASELMCQCGCALTVSACQEAMECSIAATIVQEINSQITAGKSKTEIQAYFASVYGEKVLALPKKSGFSLTAWTTPFLAVSAGAIVLGVFVWWWVKSRSQPAVREEATAEGEQELSEYRRRVERDLKALGE